MCNGAGHIVDDFNAEGCEDPAFADTPPDPSRGKTVQHLTDALIAAVRREALEEAAMIAETTCDISGYDSGYVLGCQKAAAEIRAAKDV